MSLSKSQQNQNSVPKGIICTHAKVEVVSPPSWLAYENPRWQIPFVKRPGYGLFAFSLSNLREHLPTPFPTIVRTSDVPADVDGFCIRRPCRFVIHLDRKLTCTAAVQTLLHEWAHARAWSHRVDRLDRDQVSQDEFEAVCHGPEFGAAYAEAWRLLTTRILPEWRRCTWRARRAGVAAASGGEPGASQPACRNTVDDQAVAPSAGDGTMLAGNEAR
jgi:hypothetical protein